MVYSHPKISVIVPVYNVENYLKRCVDTILTQTFTDFELILVDDGSQDKSGAICDDYARKDCRVKVFHQCNGGVSSARNLGLDNSEGEWIAFIDSDDFVANDYLAELYSYTQSDAIDYVVTLNTISKFTEDKNVVLRSHSLDLFSLYKFHNYGQPWGKLYKSEIIKKTSLYFNPEVHLCEDLMFALLYIRAVRNIVLIVSDKYFYEKGRQDSLTKRLYSFETELAGKMELDRIVHLYVPNNKLYEYEFANHQVYLTERTINAIMILPERTERLQKIRDLDLSIFLKYRKPIGWKELMLFTLLRLRYFSLYDFLLHLK